MVKLCEIAGGRNLECFPYKMHSKVRKKKRRTGGCEMTISFSGHAQIKSSAIVSS